HGANTKSPSRLHVPSKLRAVRRLRPGGKDLPITWALIQLALGGLDQSLDRGGASGKPGDVLTLSCRNSFSRNWGVARSRGRGALRHRPTHDSDGVGAASGNGRAGGLDSGCGVGVGKRGSGRLQDYNTVLLHQFAVLTLSLTSLSYSSYT